MYWELQFSSWKELTWVWSWQPICSISDICYWGNNWRVREFCPCHRLFVFFVFLVVLGIVPGVRPLASGGGEAVGSWGQVAGAEISGALTTIKVSITFKVTTLTTIRRPPCTLTNLTNWQVFDRLVLDKYMTNSYLTYLTNPSGLNWETLHYTLTDLKVSMLSTSNTLKVSI